MENSLSFHCANKSWSDEEWFAFWKVHRAGMPHGVLNSDQRRRNHIQSIMSYWSKIIIEDLYKPDRSKQPRYNCKNSMQAAEFFNPGSPCIYKEP